MPRLVITRGMLTHFVGIRLSVKLNPWWYRMSNNLSSPLDCVIVGGGAGGLTAAIYLTRFRRNVLLMDSGRSRLNLIPTSHNYPGFPSGIKGQELLHRLNIQARKFGASIQNGFVSKILKHGAQLFTIECEDFTLYAKTIILATGATDVTPTIEGSEKALKNTTLRYCPICDGFEAINKKVAVLGRGAHGVKETHFIHHYAKDLTFINSSDTPDPMEDLNSLTENNIKIFDGNINSLSFTESGLSGVSCDGSTTSFDILYSALGLKANNELAKILELEMDGDGQVEIDEHMQTSMKAVFAIGDVACGLNQISVAAGQAAIAATAIHNSIA